jgi:hypothetical protein
MNNLGEPKKKKPHKLLFQILSWIAVLGVVAGAFTYAFIAINDGVWKQRANSLSDTDAVIAKNTDTLFENRWDTLRTFANDIAVESDGTKASACSALKKIEEAASTESVVPSFLLFYSSGKYVDSSGNDAIWGNISDLAGGLEKNMATASLKDAQGQSEEKIVFFRSFATPLKADASEFAYIAKVLPTSYLSNYFTSIRYNEDAVFYLTRQDGTQIFNAGENDPLSAYNLFSAISDCPLSSQTDQSRCRRGE